MKLISRPLYTLTALLALSSSADLMAQTAVRDSINREMVLEREYVPTARQAQKAYFNPLAGTKSQALKPLNFAKNTYEVSMNVRPHLLDPIENTLAVKPQDNAWHIRLFGGYPIRYGANVGMLYKVKDKGTVELAIDHLSQNFSATERPSGYIPKNITHDSSLGLKYTGTLEDRLFSLGLDVFNGMHTMYGYAPLLGNGLLPVSPTENPLFRTTGGNVYFELGAAPVALRSPWQYSLFGNLGYVNKQDFVPPHQRGMINILDYITNASGLDLAVGGNLAYGIMLNNVNVGIDALLAGNQPIGPLKNSGIMPSQYLSIDPYISYVKDNFSIKAGARLQLLSFGPRSFLVVPKVQMKWDANEYFALLAEADGGAEINTISSLYRMNRYALGSSAYKANDVAQYKASLGIQVGNLGGFSAELKGGYADYLMMYDWGTGFGAIEPTHVIDPGANGATTYFESLTYFTAQERGRVGNFFISANARYISPIGLQASFGMKYNKYTRKIEEGSSEPTEFHNILSGRPTLEMAATLDYQILPELSAHASINGLGGIKYIVPSRAIGSNQSEVYALPFITEINARVSYKVHKNVGLSLIGLNLLNQKTERWAYYERPGASVVGAVTFNF